MPDQYSGDPGNVTTPLTATIASVANVGGLYGITTTAVHNFATNDTVLNIGTGTTADGLWKITVTGPTTYTLNGSTFGATSSTGTATDLSLTPYFQVPKDGEQPTVASILAAIKCLADRTQYLNLRTPASSALRLVANRFHSTASIAGTNWQTDTSWTAGDAVAFASAAFNGIVAANDIIEYTLSSTAVLVNPGGSAITSQTFTVQLGAVAGSTSPITDALAAIEFVIPAAQQILVPFSITTQVTASAAGSWEPCVSGFVNTGGGVSSFGLGHTNVTARLWRPVT